MASFIMPVDPQQGELIAEDSRVSHLGPLNSQGLVDQPRTDLLRVYALKCTFHLSARWLKIYVCILKIFI